MKRLAGLLLALLLAWPLLGWIDLLRAHRDDAVLLLQHALDDRCRDRLSSGTLLSCLSQ